MANLFYLHGHCNEIRSLTLDCRLISEGENRIGAGYVGRKPTGVLAVLMVPELLPSDPLLIALIMGCSCLLHLCPYQ